MSNDYRSPAATHSSYAAEDPTAQTTTTTTTYNKDVVDSDQTHLKDDNSHHHHHHHHHQQQPQGTHGHTATGGQGSGVGTDKLIKTGEYQTGLERGAVVPGGASAVEVVGNSYQNRVSGVPNNPTVPLQAPGTMGVGGPSSTVGGAHNGDGLVVDNSLGGVFGSGVVLGGQCECLRNGGTCEHGAGQCVCRGCTTRATTVNPGVNIGISTTQYTAPAGTSGIGGGVTEPGVGIAGMVHPVNTTGKMVNPTDANCECVKNGGVCQCTPGACTCNNCAAKRRSMQHTSTATTGAPITTNSNMSGNRHNIDSGHVSSVVGGSEYVTSSGGNPDAAYHSSTTTTRPITDATSPLTDNSNPSHRRV